MITRFKKLGWRWKLGGVAVLALLIAGYRWYAYLRSPEYVVHQTFAALERRDAETLVRMASEKERKTLNLTPETVTACLKSTYWKDDALKPRVRINGKRYYYADVLAYRIEVAGFSPEGRPVSSELEVYQTPDGRWHPGLSKLLYSLPKVCNGLTGDHAPHWDALARNVGIKGVISPSGGTRYNNGTFSPKIYLTHD